MDHRTRYLAAIRHEPVDKIPTDMWATVDEVEQLMAGDDSGRVQR